MIETEVICPSCLSSSGTTLASGVRLCFDCRHEWVPDEEQAVVPVPLAVVADPADGVLGPPAVVLEAQAAQARLDALIDTDVELEGGQRATILEFVDDDHVKVLLRLESSLDETATVDIGDIVRELPGPPAEMEIPDEAAEQLARTNMMVAGLAIQAGLASLEGEYPNAKVVVPPGGWMPADVDALPVVEQAVAYAVAVLVHAFELDREIVAAMADTLITDSQVPTTKGADE